MFIPGVEADVDKDFTLFGELDGILHQIHQDLPQTVGIALQQTRYLGFHQVDHFEALGLGFQ